MARIAAAPATESSRVMAEAYAVNDRMNQIVLEHLDPRAWRAKPPGGKGRTIAAIFSHVHNIRSTSPRTRQPNGPRYRSCRRFRMTRRNPATSFVIATASTATPSRPSSR